ncbi:cleavage and polyadenylation specificity factor subunit 6-like isoform X1 [Scyliorhinus canicula]|uniref:cleavage and polyadenylation specificity factor subunit 6-like isoform X1 n=3 Tax=Scyliorhinus canicula TaxID=7830 RepID=UPI0018F6175F|nr:cleavage and polyadenylation specificity factor subunit 6-like isoform X1 [Scyliorhinus canicula]
MEADFDEWTGSDNISRGRGGKGRGKDGWMARGGRGRGSRGVFRGPKDLGPPSRGESSGRFGRGQAAANGFGSARRGLENTRMRPYPDPRGRRGLPRFGPPVRRGGMECPFGGQGDMPFPPPPRFRGGGPPPPSLPLPPPQGPIGFRGRPPFIRGRGMQRGVFSPRRGFHNGPGASLPPPPPGRGQRWPGPPGGRHF